MSQLGDSRVRGPNQHRKETRRDIVLPMLGATAVFLSLIAIAAVVLTPAVRLSLLADYLFTLLVMCPLVLCVFPIVLLLVAAVFGMNRTHQTLTGWLVAAEDKSQSLTGKSIDASDSLNRRVLDLTARLEPFMKLIDFFERSDTNQGDGDDTDNTE